MAISTYQVVLKISSDGVTYAKLVDIKDFPDLGGAPEMLEITTLSDAAQKFILGIQSNQAMEFTANYTASEYTSIAASAGVAKYYSLEFGAAAADGVFKWQGAHNVHVVGGGVNAVVDMKITIAPSTVITKTA